MVLFLSWVPFLFGDTGVSLCLHLWERLHVCEAPCVDDACGVDTPAGAVEMVAAPDCVDIHMSGVEQSYLAADVRPLLTAPSLIAVLASLWPADFRALGQPLPHRIAGPAPPDASGGHIARVTALIVLRL